MKRLLLAPLLLIISGCEYLSIMNNSQNYIKKLNYRDFIEAVQEKEISRVIISPDNGKAFIIGKDLVCFEVNLRRDKDLLNILTENNVDIVVTPSGLDKLNSLKERLNFICK